MALKTADLVYETTTTSGTGPFVLGGAIVGHRTFASATEAWSIGSNQIAFVIRDQIDPVSGLRGPKFMIASGTLVDATHITVDTVYSSSNNGNPETFGSGTKDIYSAIPASLLNQLPGAGVSGTPYVAVTGSRSLTQTDNGLTLSYAGTTPITLTIPTGLSSFECAVVQAGTGVITIAAATGVTAGSASGNLATNGANSAVGVTQRGANAFLIIVPGTASVTPTPTVTSNPNYRGILRSYGASAAVADFDSTNKVTMKMEAEATFSRVRMWVFSGTQLPTSNWKFAVAATDEISNATVVNATVPRIAGASHNVIASDSDDKGWRLGTWNGGNAASGLLYPSGGYPQGYDPFTGYLKESDIIVSDWIPVRGGLPVNAPASGVKRPLLLARVVRLGTAGQTELNGSFSTDPAAYAAWLSSPQAYSRMFFAQGGLSATDPIIDPTTSPASISPDPTTTSTKVPTVAFEFDYDVAVRSVLTVGDSVTESYYWPQQAILAKSTPAAPWVPTNIGMSTHRWIEFAAYFRTMVKAGHVPTDILLPNFSINDSPQNYNQMMIQRQRLLDTLQLCQRAGIHVYLWSAYHYPGTQAAADITAFAQALGAAGKVTYVPIAENFNASTMLLGDGVHPNATGQAYMAATLLAAL